MAQKSKLSKRYTLAKLASDWRENIFSSIHSERLKLAVAILSATGCRPSEIERGIIVRARNRNLSIGIQGSKVDVETGRGQPLRVLIVDNTTPWGLYLMQQASDAVDQTMLVKYDAGGISQRLREKSRQIWPRRKTLVSAYTYRHFIGKSMKETGESTEKIARTLGHASDFSQTAYGRAGGGKRSAGMHGVIAATASNPIRHSQKSDRLARFINPDTRKMQPEVKAK